MKNCIWILLVFVILSCSSSKDAANQDKEPDFKIVNTPLVVDADTIHINELRFYNIQSARDGMMLMYQNYGEWDSKVEGTHQDNINRFIWRNVKLIDGDAATFTVIAEGTEKSKDYFACLMVFDSEGKDCFTDEHPYKEKLTIALADKMSKTDKRASAYSKVR